MVVQVFTSADTYLRSMLLLLLHVIARFFNAAKTPLTLPVLFSPVSLFLELICYPLASYCHENLQKSAQMGIWDKFKMPLLSNPGVL